jgi:peptidoglycan/LPS O-acetylase OafA/YrhL
VGILRFFLALSVVVWHLPSRPFALLYAAVAVVCFFMISGFYMAMVLTEKYRGQVGVFYRARFWRLYPAYAAMAIAMVVWFTVRPSPNPFTWRLPVPWHEQIILALLQVTIAGQDIYELMNHIRGAPLRQFFSDKFFNPQWMLVGQAWSLSTEFFFYLMAPFVVRSVWRTAAALALFASLRMVLLWTLGWTWEWGYWFFPGAMLFFLMGSLAYHLHRLLAVKADWIGWAALVAFSVLLVWQVAAQGILLPAGPGASIDGGAFWIFYAVFAAAVPFVFNSTKSITWDRWIGDLSYPLYLVHGVVLGVVFARYKTLHDTYWLMAVGVGLSVAGAIAMRVIVELPFERRRHTSVRTARSGVRMPSHSAGPLADSEHFERHVSPGKSASQRRRTAWHALRLAEYWCGRWRR